MPTIPTYIGPHSSNSFYYSSPLISPPSTQVIVQYGPDYKSVEVSIHFACIELCVTGNVCVFVLCSSGRWSVMNMASALQGTMRATPHCSWRGSVSTTMRPHVSLILELNAHLHKPRNNTTLKALLLKYLWWPVSVEHSLTLWGLSSLENIHFNPIVLNLTVIYSSIY